MCKFWITKSLRKRFLHKYQNSESVIFALFFVQKNYQITKVESVDNFNPSAKDVNNTYYAQEQKDEELNEENR